MLQNYRSLIHKRARCYDPLTKSGGQFLTEPGSPPIAQGEPSSLNDDPWVIFYVLEISGWITWQEKNK